MNKSNKIKNFILKEISGWSKFEIIFLPCILIFVLASSLYLKDSIIATISAIGGLSYTILAGKGKISCYIIGMIGTLCYSYLSWKNLLFGNLLLYIGYYFPMEIIGIFVWKKHLKKDSQEIKKTYLSKKQRLIIFVILLILSLLTTFFLKYFKDSSPFLDSFTTIFSIAGMYLTVKRCIEQWIIWTIVNICSAIMWLKLFLSGAETFATFLMWAIYIFLGIYFLIKWKTEIDKENKI